MFTLEFLAAALDLEFGQLGHDALTCARRARQRRGVIHSQADALIET